MGLYVLTENNYLYAGFNHLFSQYFNQTCIHLTPKNVIPLFKLTPAKPDDIFIIASDSLFLSFSLLLYLNKLESRVLLIKNKSNEKLVGNLACDFLDENLPLDAILSVFLNKNKRRDLFTFPVITDREKTVLLYTLNGLSVSSISERLNIAMKTVYAHKHNVLRKIGVRKVGDIIRFPNDYIAHLHSPGELTTVGCCKVDAFEEAEYDYASGYV